MRAREFPALLFKVIKKKLIPLKGCIITHNFNFQGNPMKVIFFEEEQAVMGLVENVFCKDIGTTSYLKFWNMDFGPYFTSANFDERIFGKNPDFEVTGGTLLTSVWKKGKGYQIIQVVVCGPSRGYFLGDPFPLFINYITSITEMLYAKKKPDRIEYFQKAFFRENDYSKQPQ